MSRHPTSVKYSVFTTVFGHTAASLFTFSPRISYVSLLGNPVALLEGNDIVVCNKSRTHCVTVSYNNKNDLQAFQLMTQCYMQSNNQICSTCPSSQHLYEMLQLAEAAVRSIKLNARRCCLSVTLTDRFALHAGLPIMCACLASESYCSGCQETLPTLSPS